ncbi:hypothetical protein Hanom_Chr17g01532061 [Helianthus anomalus]
MGLTEVECKCYKSESSGTVLPIFKLMDCNRYFQQTTRTKNVINSAKNIKYVITYCIKHQGCASDFHL